MVAIVQAGNSARSALKAGADGGVAANFGAFVQRRPGDPVKFGAKPSAACDIALNSREFGRDAV